MKQAIIAKQNNKCIEEIVQDLGMLCINTVINSKKVLVRNWLSDKSAHSNGVF